MSEQASTPQTAILAKVDVRSALDSERVEAVRERAWTRFCRVDYHGPMEGRLMRGRVHRQWLGGLASVVIMLAATMARADVVPEPPDDCPAGTTPTTSHSGAKCLEPAPTNCPSGWRGEVGGACVLDFCTSDAECRDGRRCVAQSICHVERICHPREFCDSPVFEPRWVCGGALSCRSPAECRPGKLCLAAGTRRAADSPNPDDPRDAADLSSGCSSCQRRQPVGHGMALASLVALTASFSGLRRTSIRARSARSLRTALAWLRKHV